MEESFWKRLWTCRLTDYWWWWWWWWWCYGGKRDYFIISGKFYLKWKTRNTAAMLHCGFQFYSIFRWRMWMHLRFLRKLIHLLWARVTAETRFRLSAKRTCSFKSAGASVKSTTGSRGECISGSNVGYAMFRGSVKGTGYPLPSPVSPSLPLPCVTVCHHISTGLYNGLDAVLTHSVEGPHNVTWWQ